MKEQIETLEIKIAHQEHTIAELSDEVFQQQKQLQRLEELFSQLLQRMDSLASTGADGNPADEMPPHY
jgi:SlyX protein